MQIEHSFNIYLAQEVGVPKAILLKHIDYWVYKNEVNKKNMHDGKYWTYNSARAFHKMFAYWTSESIRRWLIELERDGWLITGNYNKRRDDKTKWFSRGATLEKWVRDNLHLTIKKSKSKTLPQNVEGSQTLPQNVEGVTQIMESIPQNVEALPNNNQIFKPNTSTTNSANEFDSNNIKEIVANISDFNDREQVMGLVHKQILRMTGKPTTSFNLAEQEHLEKHIYGDSRFKIATALTIVLEAIPTWAISGKTNQYDYFAGPWGIYHRGIIGNMKQKYLDKYNKQKKESELQEANKYREKTQADEEKYIKLAINKIRAILNAHKYNIESEHFERINDLLNKRKWMSAQIELQKLIEEEIILEYEEKTD